MTCFSKTRVYTLVFLYVKFNNKFSIFINTKGFYFSVLLHKTLTFFSYIKKYRLNLNVDIPISIEDICVFEVGIDSFSVSPDTFTAKGYVQGSRRAPYRASVEGREELEPADLEGTYSCPIGDDCKHVVTLIDELQRGLIEASPSSFSDNDFGSWLAALEKKAPL